MFIGALLDAGADPTILEKELKKLHFEEEYQLTWKKIVKNGITGTKFDVALTQTNHHHGHDHHHGHEHHHNHDHHHEHSHHHHRSYIDIVKMIESSDLAADIKRCTD